MTLNASYSEIIQCVVFQNCVEMTGIIDIYAVACTTSEHEYSAHSLSMHEL